MECKHPNDRGPFVKIGLETKARELLSGEGSDIDRRHLVPCNADKDKCKYVKKYNNSNQREIKYCGLPEF